MTQEASPAESPVAELRSAEKKQRSIEEIMASLEDVGADIEQIAKLTSEEKAVVTQFLELLKNVPQPMFSIAVSPSELPSGVGAFTRAYLDSTGHLILMSEEGHVEVMDLRDVKTLDLMMAVAGGVVPKFESLPLPVVAEQPQEPLPVKELAPPEPPAEPLPVVDVVEPMGLADSDDSDAECVQKEVPVSLAAEEAAENADNVAIAEAAAETLESLAQLGSEVFEHSPVSMYFDDWLACVRQVISTFESSDVISVDEVFTEECARIFSVVEGELAKRRLEEAELEASAKTLAENKHFLGEIDAEYSTQVGELVVKGESVIDFLTKSVRDLEEELARIRQIKTSRLHPLRRRAKAQKQLEVTQKLVAAKRKLALAVQHSAVEQEKLGALDAKYAAQAKILAAKRKSAIDFLAKNVHDLEEELAALKQVEVGRLHPLKKRANEQRQLEVAGRLIAAKKRLALAKQHSGAEQKKLREEYERKKQATVVEMQRLEKEIASKETDGSLEARQKATNALANAVQALIQRKTTPSQ